MCSTMESRGAEMEEDDLIFQLRSLKQVSHIRSYIEAFDELNSRAGIEEDQALSIFLSGLVDEIRVPVCMFEPKTLADAYALSKLQELTITGVLWCDRKKQYENEVDYSTKEWKLDSEMEDEKYADEEIDLHAEIDVFEEEEADWDVQQTTATVEADSEHAACPIGEICDDNKELYFLSSSLESKGYPKVEKSGKESEEMGSQNQRSFLQSRVRENAQMKELVFGEGIQLAVDAGAGEILDQGKVIGIELLVDLLDNKTLSQAKEIKETKRMPSARRNVSLREFAVTLNAATNLTRLQVRYPKPLVKMKFMVVPIDSCRVFKGGGMTRATHMQVQHGKVIGGELGKLFDRDKGRLQRVTRIIARVDGSKHIETTLTRVKFEEICLDLLGNGELMKELMHFVQHTSKPFGIVEGIFRNIDNMLADIEDIGGLEWFLASSYASSSNYRSLKQLLVQFPRPMVKMKFRRYPDMGESCIEAVMLSKFLCFEASRAFGYLSKCLRSEGQIARVHFLFDPMKLYAIYNLKGLMRLLVVLSHHLSYGVVAHWFSKPRVKMKLEKIKPREAFLLGDWELVVFLGDLELVKLLGFSCSWPCSTVGISECFLLGIGGISVEEKLKVWEGKAREAWLHDSLWTRNLKGEGLLRSQIVGDTYMHAT